MLKMFPNMLITNLQMEKHSLDVEILALSEICQKYSQNQENSMGDGEKKLLRILDQIGVKRQAYHGSVFVGNHWKVILAKDKNQVFNFVKLCSVLTDEVTKDHLVELFRIYSEARSLMARRHLLSENEKNFEISMSQFWCIVPSIFLKAP